MISAASLVRSARRRAGLTQRELAKRARIPQPTIAAIEAGRQDPRYATLSKLLRGCGYELDYERIAGGGVDRGVRGKVVESVRSPIRIGDAEVLVAAVDDLIRMKRAAGRPKDRAMLEELGALRDEIARRKRRR